MWQRIEQRLWHRSDPAAQAASDERMRTPPAPIVVTRRQLLQRGTVLGASLVGLGAGMTTLSTLLTGCSETTNPSFEANLDLRTEVGLLNYAYALLQLEEDFYYRIRRNKYPDMTLIERDGFDSFFFTIESARLTVKANHIPAGRITDALLFRTGKLVNFSDRDMVLAHAKVIAETSAQALETIEAGITTPAKQTLIADLLTAAQDRATQVNSWLGTTFTPGPIDLVAAMTTLRPYYSTTITVTPA